MEYDETCCGSGACAKGIKCCGGVCLKTGETCCGLTIQSICTSSTTTSRRSTTDSFTTSSRTSTADTSTLSTTSWTTTTSKTARVPYVFPSSIVSAPGAITTATTALTATGADLLASVMPVSVWLDPAAACFLHTEYTSLYTTPAWYKTIPANAQSAFAALRTGLGSNVCTGTKVSTNDDAGGGGGVAAGGLRRGARVGIGAGVPIAALLFGLLLLRKFKPGVFGSKKGKAGDENETEKTTETPGPFAYSAASELTSSPAMSKSTPMTMNSTVVAGGADTKPKVYPVGIGATGHHPTEIEAQNEFSQQPTRSELYDNATVMPEVSSNNTISRRPVATQYTGEAGRSELTVSPHSEPSNFSPRIGAHELAGLERYEMDGGDQRHEAPPGIRQ